MFVDLVREECGDEKTGIEETRFCCPFCGETKYKMYVENEEPFRWICFKCDERGNPVSFVMKYYGVNYREAIDILLTYDYDIEDLDLSRFNSKYKDDSLTESEILLLAMRDVEKKKNGIFDNNDEPTSLKMPPLPTGTKFFQYEASNPEALPYLQYLASRGVTAEQVIKHGMGYVPKGIVSLDNGKILELDSHVLFLTYDVEGNPIYWNTRAIKKDAFIKSFNAPNQKDEYGKSTTIFNLNNAKKTGRIIINEGVFNALSCGESGVATFGKQITHEQLMLLKQAVRYDKDMKFYIFLDRDAYDKGDKLGEQLSAFTKNVFLVMNPTDDDANDMTKEQVDYLIETALPFNTANRLKYLLLKS